MACPICMDPATKPLACGSVSEGHAVCDDCYLRLKEMSKEVFVDGEFFVLDTDLPVVCPLCRGSEPPTTEMVKQLKRCWGLKMIEITTYQDEINDLSRQIEEMREDFIGVLKTNKELKTEVNTLLYTNREMKSDLVETQQALCDLTEEHVHLNGVYDKLVVDHDLVLGEEVSKLRLENDRLKMESEDKTWETKNKEEGFINIIYYKKAKTSE